MKKNLLTLHFKIFFTLSLFLSVFFAKSSFSSEIEKGYAQKLSLQDVVDSATLNYPKVLALYQEVEAAKGSVLASKGFFDVKLRQAFVDQSRGFYDGKYLDTEIAKKNQFLNSEIYAGYRRSDGTFQDYEGHYYTNHDGEFRVGAKFSLLRNSMIDEDRLRLILSKLSLEESKFALANIKNEIKKDAKIAYYAWIVSHEIYKIYRELYELALNRNKQLEVRVRRGDLAAIILIENERNALKRKTEMLKAKQSFENSSIYLSLFYRDDNGDPIIVSEANVPESLRFSKELAKIKPEKIDKDLIQAYQRRADLKIINISKKKQKQNLKQAKNLYKPRLDIKFEASNDISNEDTARGQSKNEASLNFEIPLQQRTAKGEIAKAKSMISKIKYEEKLLRETIKVRVKQSQISINNIVEMSDNLTQEIDLSLKLEKAEKTRFTRGGSDFFLINMREQNTATAKISSVINRGNYLKEKAKYEAEIFSYD